jgi:hypothetical protein
MDKLLLHSPEFKKKYISWDKINKNIFNNQLDKICQLTDDIVNKLFIEGRGLRYTYLENTQQE